MIRALPLLLFALPAWGADYWVDLSGSGTGAADGSSVANQCAGFTDADCPEGAGDTVYVCNASETQWVPDVSGAVGNHIVYDWSCPGGVAASVVVSGSTAAISLSTRTDLTIRHATISQSGTARCINFAGADRITIEDSAIGDCSPGGAGSEGAVVFSPSVDSDDVVLDSNTITSSTGNCIALINGTGAIDYANLSIINNTIGPCGDSAASEEHGIRLHLASGGGASITGLMMTGNTITGAARYGAQIVEASSTQSGAIIDPIIANNVMRANGRGGLFLQGATSSSGGAYNAIYTNDFSGNLGQGGGLVLLFSTYLNIVSNVCSDTVVTDGTIDGGGIDIDRGNSYITVMRNDCSNNVGNSGVANGGYGVMVLNSSNITVSSNILRGNKIGISYNPNYNSPESDGTGNLFMNNDIAGNAQSGVQVNGDSTADTALFVNNVIVNNGVGAAVGDGDSDQTFDYNVFYGNIIARENSMAGAYDISADPLFLGGPNPTTADGFRPSATSPLVGAGTDVGSVQDFFGDTYYATPDIGAFRRDSCYRRSRDGKLDMARTRAQVVSRCLGIPGRYPEGL